MGQLTDQVAAKVAPRVLGMMEVSPRKHAKEYMEKTISEQLAEMDSLRERMEKMVSERLAELNPEPPPHGITGKPCPKDGLYRVQQEGGFLDERVFEEGDIFPPATTKFGELAGFPIGMNEVKVLWVYQTPRTDE